MYQLVTAAVFLIADNQHAIAVHALNHEAYVS
jgi:hypothetical protein